jgi:hypothetical protein
MDTNKCDVLNRAARASCPGRHFPGLVVLLLAVSCAKIAQPLPPVHSVVAATQQLELVQIGTSVRLSYPRPSAEIRAVLIFRQCGAESEWEARPPIARIEFGEEPVTPPDRLTYTDAPAQSGCRYAVRYDNGRRRLSAYSNVRQTSPEPAPLPPTKLQAAVESDRIVLTWEAPERNVLGQAAAPVGYLVNDTHLVSAPEFVDTDFAFGEPRVYRVQAISRMENPRTLSFPSPELTITPRDIFGPPAPQGLVGLFSQGQVRLLWEAVQATDLAGYRVYRGLQPDQMEVIAPLVTGNSFLDPSPPSRPTTLYYRVSAIDQLGNEGETSAPARLE